jgi:hypothetical protein
VSFVKVYITRVSAQWFMSFVKTTVAALWDLGEVVRYQASINLGSQRHLLLNKWLTSNQVVSVVCHSNK